MAKRVILIILDSVGIGEMEDSYLYGDKGSNTLQNLAKAVGGLNLPNMQDLGLGNIELIEGVAAVENARGAFGKMLERSKGKDSTTGHWEMMGLVMDEAFPTYPQGFPPQLIAEFEKRIGRKTIGNIVASGTEIIEIMGSQHMATAYPIVYTSADSVFQIAAHEDIIPLAELYEICQIARDLLAGEHGVGRVIARPFTGQAGQFKRTANRHDYSLQPEKTVLNFIIEAGLKVVGIGKISDLFAAQGLSENHPSKSNHEGIEKIIELVQQEQGGLLFANLLDFDQIYGHRNDIDGYARALEEFDRRLAEIMTVMLPEDMLIISADHGCDPTTPSTDHSREYVPVLVYGKSILAGINLGTRRCFADLGQTIAEYLDVKTSGLAGESFYPLLRRD